MSRLQGRVARLERREGALARPPRHDDRPTLEDCFDALTDVQEREGFITLVGDVHAIQQREVEALDAGQAIPPRSLAEQARMDELDQCVERQRGDDQCKAYGHV